jgi:dipeptidyl aminopeptidase/acylaminoacyl peptidase
MDLMKIHYVSDPRISPDGRKIAFVKTKMDYKKDGYYSNLWLADIEANRYNQLTFMNGRTTNPQWSSDGKKIFFISTIFTESGNKHQLFSISIITGKINRVIDMETSINSPKLSPDGKQVLFISPFRKEEPKSDVKIIKRLKYKFNGVGFLDGRRNHIFTVSAKGGKPHQITHGEYDVDSANWLKDSQQIAFISNIDKDADMTRDKYIYSIDKKASEPNILTDGPKVVTSLKPSPKGDVIAYVGHDYRRRLWSNQDIWIVPVEGGVSKNITREFDQDIGYKLSSDVIISRNNPNPQWSNDADSLYFSSTYGGAVRLYKVTVEGGCVQEVLGGIDHSIQDWSISKNNVIAYNLVKTTAPLEMWLKDQNGSRQITDLNKKYLNETKIMDHEQFVFQSSGDHDVEGWLMKPPSFDENNTYPLILYIRGGSAGCFGNSFMHRYQVLAAQGWIVLYVNQWGNGGYNEAFQGEASGHYGEQEYKDLMEAVDYISTKYPFVNTDKLGVTGSSQGGFLTNWIITHNDKFKAAIPQASISNWHSDYGCSDIGWTFGQYDMEGMPWSDEEKYLSMSPIRYASKVKTPTMIIHAEKDYRCCLEQAEQWFTALKVLGVPTEFVIFPDEHHGIRKPKHRVELLYHIIRWFKEYL